MPWISTVSIMLVGSSLASGTTHEMAFVGGRGTMPRCSSRGSHGCPLSGTPGPAAAGTCHGTVMHGGFVLPCERASMSVARRCEQRRVRRCIAVCACTPPYKGCYSNSSTAAQTAATYGSAKRARPTIEQFKFWAWDAKGVSVEATKPFRPLCSTAVQQYILHPLERWLTDVLTTAAAATWFLACFVHYH